MLCGVFFILLSSNSCETSHPRISIKNKQEEIIVLDSMKVYSDKLTLFSKNLIDTIIPNRSEMLNFEGLKRSELLNQMALEPESNYFFSIYYHDLSEKHVIAMTADVLRSKKVVHLKLK